MAGLSPQFPPRTRLANEEQVHDVLASRAPYAEWPKDLRELHQEEQSHNAVRELRFHLLLGLMVAVMSLGIDAIAAPAMLTFALGWKLLTVVPLTAIGLLFLRSEQIVAIKLVTSLSIICFGAGVIVISTYAGPDMSIRYSMASAMLLGAAMLLLPFTPREAGRFGMAYALVTILAAMWPNALSPMAQLNHVITNALIGIPCWIMVHRFWELRSRSFLLGLHDQTLRAELERSNAQLRELSQHDPLTGLANRRHFENEFHAKYQAIEWGKGRTALMLIDLDRFKLFNDSYGHLAGDQYLRQAAATLNRVVQASGGLAARYGGEEFVVVVREKRSGEAKRIAEAFREEMTKLVLDLDTDDTEPLTASIGIAHASTSHAETLERIIARADAALYQAKRQGRDRVIFADIIAA